MALNDWFTQHYRLRRQEIERELRRGTPPLFVRLGDELLFFHAGRRRSATVRDAHYHRLKSEAHVPVALHLWLTGQREAGSLSLEELHPVRRDLACALEERPDNDLLGEIVAWLDELPNTQAIDALLPELEERTRAAVRHRIDEAAAVEMRSMHDAVGQWTAGLDDDAWSRVRALVCAGRQPRYRQSSRQYFDRLLRVEPADKSGAKQGRVLYAENVRSEEEALQHVATHLLDRELGEAFMDSPLALQQDLMADAASRALDELGLPRVGAEGREG